MGEGTSALEQEQRGPHGFAEHVLVAALRAPGAASSPSAGRTIAGLIGLLTAEGADTDVASILAPRPEGTATFDVNAVGASVARRGREATAPAPALTGLDVGRALREASRLAQGGAERISVVAVGPDGVRRRVLERTGGGLFCFLFPSHDTFGGHPDRCAAALDSWRRFLETPSEVPAPSGNAAPEGSTPNPIALVGSPARPASASRELEPATMAPPDGLNAEMLGDSIRDALSDVTVEVDMGAIEEVVDRALRAALATSRARDTPAAPDPPGGWVTHAALIGAAEELHVLMEAFNDRVRAGSRSLEALADELNARERTAAAFTDALAKSINTSLDRMLRHIDNRLDQLPTSRTRPRPAT